MGSPGAVQFLDNAFHLLGGVFEVIGGILGVKAIQVAGTLFRLLLQGPHFLGQFFSVFSRLLGVGVAHGGVDLVFSSSKHCPGRRGFFRLLLIDGQPFELVGTGLIQGGEHPFEQAHRGFHVPQLTRKGSVSCLCCPP